MSEISPLITSAISSIISGIFIGAGIATGFYLILKRQLPKWVHEFRQEFLRDNAIEKALEGRKNYSWQ